MARLTGRSRGCQTCIKRRIKCNEETPACYQCVSAGWDCPGPVEGVIFVDMSEGVRQKRTRHTSRPSNKKLQNTRKSNSSPDSTVTAPILDSVERGNLIFQASKLPTSYQPSRGDIFRDLYLANFISLQDASMHPWINHLPKLASSSTGHSELYGIRAATLALYAKLSHNQDLELEAAKWYSKGLDAQREQLPLAAKSQSYSPCIHKAVGAALMFSYFESVICTLPMGWMQHYAAAIKMFEIAGPENCQTGLMHMFFCSMRVAAFITALTEDQPSVFASILWCTVPFQQTEKTPFDKLVDILLQLPSCLPYRNEMRKTRNSHVTTSESLRRYLETTASHILSQLDEFWQENKDAIDPDYDQRLIQTITSHSSNKVDGQQSIPFTSPANAYFTSMYDAGRFITLGLLEAASLVPSLYNQAVIMHGASILSSAVYCETQGLFNGVSFSMVFPIKLVCLLSPSELQRSLAQDTLLKWGSERGLSGICKVAAPSYLDRSHG
ncbi:uncharacterized protein PAC_18549 [Phialocephala subalpina]|uniref:Zn(2)-C6 fungal-type domain-containing protein n=1 Tax=Phialocephala subalpina TaxID=576137 RepID=A0A1L7XUF8_9HELO|nr:uncharacterized protein PAC_18549 [Phialocephala subalpina]